MTDGDDTSLLARVEALVHSMFSGVLDPDLIHSDIRDEQADNEWISAWVGLMVSAPPVPLGGMVVDGRIERNESSDAWVSTTVQTDQGYLLGRNLFGDHWRRDGVMWRLVERAPLELDIEAWTQASRAWKQANPSRIVEEPEIAECRIQCSPATVRWELAVRNASGKRYEYAAITVVLSGPGFYLCGDVAIGDIAADDESLVRGHVRFSSDGMASSFRDEQLVGSEQPFEVVEGSFALLHKGLGSATTRVVVCLSEIDGT